MNWLPVAIQLGATGGVLSLFWFALTWREQKRKLSVGTDLTDAQVRGEHADAAQVLTGISLEIVRDTERRAAVDRSRTAAAQQRADDAIANLERSLGRYDGLMRYVQNLLDILRSAHIEHPPIPEWLTEPLEVRRRPTLEE